MKPQAETSAFMVRVASIVSETEALGPGKRAALWVQGCPFCCPGCIRPEWLSLEGGTVLTAAEIVPRLLTSDVNGITLSGGEPMSQAAGLAEVIRLARRVRDLDVICFTGYRYERLQNHPPNPGVAALLAQIDVLVDGPYIAALHTSIGLRGSSNQRIIHLTPRLQHEDLEHWERKVEVEITEEDVSMIGIPSSSLLSSVHQLSGVHMPERK